MASPGGQLAPSLPGRIEPSPWAYRFAVEGGLLLLDQRSSRLFAYNETARHVWELIQAGRANEELVREFAEAWEIPVSLAQSDVDAIVALWRMQGLLGGNRTPTAPVGPARHASVVESSIFKLAGRATEWTCTFRDKTIAFAVEDERLATVRIMLAHLETPGVRAQTRIEIATAASGEMVLAVDGMERVRTRDDGLLVGGLWQTILERIHPNVEWLALIHGAAVARNGNGLALCGPSGSGKSTLTAGLVEAGFDFLADDLVAVSAPDGAIVPWPMPISLKPGSFAAVAQHRADLAEAPRYRTKGVEARLVAPSPTVWNTPATRLRHIVFPSFTAGAAAELRPISTFQAVERLLADRIWIGHPITADRVAGLLALLNETSAYTAIYGTLGDGTRLIQEAVA